MNWSFKIKFLYASKYSQIYNSVSGHDIKSGITCVVVQKSKNLRNDNDKKIVKNKTV